MPRDLPPELPGPLRLLLDGRDLAAKEGETLLLMTAPPDGWPRLALLSVGELYAPSLTELRLALWPDSHTTRNLTATGRGTLSAMIEGTTYDVELVVRREPDIRSASRHLARFTATIRSVRSDLVAYAEITSPIRFRLRDRDAVLDRWRRNVEDLRSAARADEPEPDGM